MLLQCENNDDKTIRRLRLVESTSPSNKPSQRVACLIASDTGQELIATTNTFWAHSGVHAELNAIAQLIDYLCDHDKDAMLMNKQLYMVVTFSPCMDCVELLGMFQQVTNIDFRVFYEFIFDPLALHQLVNGLGIEATKLSTSSSSDCVERQESKKLHSYSIQPSWEKKVTGIRIMLQSDRSIVMELGMNDNNQLQPFDIRPYVMNAMLLHRRNISLYFYGQLNHREKMFLNICGIEWICLKNENCHEATCVITE